MTLGDIVVCPHCKRAGGTFVLVERTLVHPECRSTWVVQALCQSVRQLLAPATMSPEQRAFLKALRAHRRAAQMQRVFLNLSESP